MGQFDTIRQKFAPKMEPEVPQPAAAAGRMPYEAFDTKDRLYRVDLRANDGLAHALPYNHMLLLTYDRREYKEILLTISGVTATIRGRNLRPLVDALKLHTCEFVQAFDATEFEPPVDATAPFVDRVEVEIIRGPVLPERTQA